MSGLHGGRAADRAISGFGDKSWLREGWGQQGRALRACRLAWASRRTATVTDADA